MRSSTRYAKSNRISKAIPEDEAIMVDATKAVVETEDVDVVKEVEVAAEGGVRVNLVQLDIVGDDFTLGLKNPRCTLLVIGNVYSCPLRTFTREHY